MILILGEIVDTVVREQNTRLKAYSPTHTAREMESLKLHQVDKPSKVEHIETTSKTMKSANKDARVRRTPLIPETDHVSIMPPENVNP